MAARLDDVLVGCSANLGLVRRTLARIDVEQGPQLVPMARVTLARAWASLETASMLLNEAEEELGEHALLDISRR